MKATSASRGWVSLCLMIVIVLSSLAFPKQAAFARSISETHTKDTPDAPEITVNHAWWTVIVNGDTTPSLSDGTDFGGVDVANGTITTQFQVENIGTADLHLTGTPLVEISGPNAADFTVTEEPSNPIEAGILGADNILNIAFDPSDYGIRTATISISNDDSDENPYTFTVQGTGVDGASEMDMYGRGKGSYYLSLLTNGDTSPDMADGTDFGNVDVDNGIYKASFRINNSGNANLNLTGTPAVAISGPHASDFVVTTQPPSALGNSVEFFEIVFDPSSEGIRLATVSIANNDPDDNPYTFTIQGTGIVGGVAEMSVHAWWLDGPIADGDISPSPLDATDFGNGRAANFCIENAGSANLVLTGNPAVEISGPNATDVTVYILPDTGTLVPLGSGDCQGYFGLNFVPGESGLRSATVSIANDGPGNPFTFAIQAWGIGSFTSCAEVNIPQAECEALVALYNSTDGAQWTDHTDWLQTNTPCNWYGVSCDSGHVIMLQLGSNNLFGAIPPELGNLTQLKKLHLNLNQLNGSIPSQLGNLTQLQFLLLYNNQLSGSIPPQLGDLINLTYLHLSGNQLSGSIPVQLGDLTQLTILSLNYNQLSGSIPAELGNLAMLTDLWLDNNQLSGSIPSQLGNLAQLSYLTLANNQLSGFVPPQLGGLTELTELYLYGNQLTGSIPVELSALTKLQYLSLGNNQLTGSIPWQLGNLINLKFLRLSVNQLSGSIPAQLGNLTNLTNLYLDNNQLTGFIPTQLGNLEGLSQIALAYNQLSGPIPSELGNLANLRLLALEDNQLSGPIPSELGSLTSLQWLTLKDNHLSGEFPSSTTSLVNLYMLTFDCWITSSDPAVIAFVENLAPGWQDRVCLQSVAPAGAPISHAVSVDFTVTFSEPVTGVDPSDFSPFMTGDLSGASILGVTGGPASYTVAVDTGTGNGAIRLDIVDDDTILDLEGNPLGGPGLGNGNYTGGQTYAIIKTPTFGDVSTSFWAWGYIERLYNAGITGGCSTNPVKYCPENQVTRGQMAVFLLKGMYGKDYVAPAATGTVFNDVPVTHMFARWIEQLAAEGITGGCGGGNYCPNSPVNREQMAVFLLVAKHGVGYAPPAASGVFSDVPAGYAYAAWIEQLAAEGITGGCGGGKYCPKQIVNRAQMAVFLVKAFNLP